MSAEGASGAARQICKSGLPSRNEAGRESWLLYGETPIIVALNGVDPVAFDAVGYINELRNFEWNVKEKP
jgi:hypothetical protein